MVHRRRHQPVNTQPSAPALVAAAAVYRPSPTPSSSSLAAAAAGAALRNASVSPPLPEQRIGSIPTKRMLKRQDSYSSSTSDGSSLPGGVSIAVQRRTSNGSLADRTFRKERPGSRILERSPVEEEEEGEEAEGRFQTRSPTYSLRSTMRGEPIPLRHKRGDRRLSQTGNRDSVLSRGSLRDNPAGGVMRSPSVLSTASSYAGRSATSPGPRNGTMKQPRNTTSNASFTSDLDSVAERHPTKHSSTVSQPRNIPVQELEESSSEFLSSDEEELVPPRATALKPRIHRRPLSPPPPPQDTTTPPPPPPIPEQSERRRTWAMPSTEPKPAPVALARSSSVASSRNNSSPSRAHFGGVSANVVRHEPPPRSVSPAKPALKHSHPHDSPLLNGATRTSQDAFSPPSSTTSDNRKRTARVSFSEEDSIASFSDPRPEIISADGLQRRDPLPVFGSIRDSRNEEEHRQSDGLHSTNGINISAASFHPVPPKVTSIPQPPSDSDFTSTDESDDEMHFRKKTTDSTGLHYPEDVNKPRGRSSHLPEFNLIQPTPQEEKPEPLPVGRPAGRYLTPEYVPPRLGASSHDGSREATTPSTKPAVLARDEALLKTSQMADFPGAFPSGTRSVSSSDSDSDSSDGDSIYSDAFEILPSEAPPSRPVAVAPTNLSSIAENTGSPVPHPPSPTPMVSPQESPVTATRTLPSGIRRPPSPPLPPDYAKPTPMPRRRRSATPPPRHRRSHSYQQDAPPTPRIITNDHITKSATAHPQATLQRRGSDASTSSSLSDSSFRRSNPSRKKFTGLRTSMRSSVVPPPPPRLTAPPRRFSSDSSEGERGSTGGHRLNLGWSKKKTRVPQQPSAPWRSRFEDSSEDEPVATPGSKPATLPSATRTIQPAQAAPTSLLPPTSRANTLSSAQQNRPASSILRRFSTGPTNSSRATTNSFSAPNSQITPLLPTDKQVSSLAPKPPRPNRLQKRKSSVAGPPIIARSATPGVRVRSPVSGTPLQRAKTPVSRNRTPVNGIGSVNGTRGPSAGTPTPATATGGVAGATAAAATRKKDIDAVPIRPVKTKRKWWGGKKKVPVVYEGEVDDVKKIGPIVGTGKTFAGAGAAGEELKMTNGDAPAAAVAAPVQASVNGVGGNTDTPTRTEKKKGKGWKRLLRKWA